MKLSDMLANNNSLRMGLFCELQTVPTMVTTHDFHGPYVVRFFVFSSTGVGEMRTGIDHVEYHKSCCSEVQLFLDYILFGLLQASG